jgi:NAD(P) transhydrogenase subunit beta
MEQIILWITYLVGSITFILGLKMLSHPESARRGNLVAAAGMTLAIWELFFYTEIMPANGFIIMAGSSVVLL